MTQEYYPVREQAKKEIEISARQQGFEAHRFTNSKSRNESRG
jgi:hypothetical protein